MREIVGEAFTESTILDVLHQAHGDLDIALDMLIPVEEYSPDQDRDVRLDESREEIGTSAQATVSSPLVLSEGLSDQHELEVIDIDVSEPSLSGCLNQPSDSNISLSEILEQHSASVVVEEPVIELEVNRAKLWRQASAFYKNTKLNPESNRLRRHLSIEFQDEEGIDAGALRYDFFESLLCEASERLFEGPSHSKLPRKDWGLESSLELAGLMVAHSLVHGGPGFPVLNPAVYEFMVSLDREKAAQSISSVSIIPKTAATAELVDFIERVRCTF